MIPQAKMDEFGLKARLLRLSPWAVWMVAACTSLAGIEEPMLRPDDGEGEGGAGAPPASSLGGAGGEGNGTSGGSGNIGNSGSGGSSGNSGSTNVALGGHAGVAGDGHGGDLGDAGEAGSAGAVSLPECQAQDVRCNLYQPQHCVAGHWEDYGATCSLACVDGACQHPPSCATTTTGAEPCVDGVSCCETIWVPGGSYDMGKASALEPDLDFPRTVSGFYLDRFEVTVGRLRAFAADYRLPLEGGGKHPLFAASGWRKAWEELPHPVVDDATVVPKTGEELIAQLSTQCSEVERTWDKGEAALPANCVNWYVAFAFCAWDGGRLPTEAEWNYAAAYGDAGRPYPWSVDENDIAFGEGNGAFNFDQPEPFTAPVPVGSFANGRGGFQRYPGRGHDDLGGNVAEWTLDQWTFEPVESCSADCYEAWTDNNVQERPVRGGCYGSPYDDLRTGNRTYSDARSVEPYWGFRCARDVNTHPE